MERRRFCGRQSPGHPSTKVRWRNNCGDSMKHTSRALIVLVVAGLLTHTSSLFSGGTNLMDRAKESPGQEHDLGFGSRTIVGITVGLSNLTNVQNRLGSNPVWSSGDASTAASSVCYITQGSDPAVIAFASNAEMAGPPENIVTDVSILPRDTYPSASHCWNIAISANAIATNSGLKLGLRKRDVARILGMPTGPSGSVWNFTWTIRRLVPSSDKNYQLWLARKEECFNGQAPFVTTVSSILVRFNGDLVASLKVSRINSIC